MNEYGPMVTCGDCSAHFLIDPKGDVQSAACPDCGGKRFFRHQLSPTKGEMDGDFPNQVLDMPGAAGSDSPSDPGGNSLSEGLARPMSKSWFLPDTDSHRISAGEDPELERMLRGYQEAALWSSLNHDDSPLDRSYEVSDIHPDTVTGMRNDLNHFRQNHSDQVNQYLNEQDPEAFGHEFWLNRNGHGTGFWDNDNINPDLGQQLSDISNQYGPSDIYVGDDNMIHGNYPPQAGNASDYAHPDPWMDNEPGSLTFPSHWGRVSFSTCPNCGGEMTDGFGCPNCGLDSTMAPNSNANHPDLARGVAGNPESEGTIVGEDGVQDPHASTHGYDGYTHSHVASSQLIFGDDYNAPEAWETYVSHHPEFIQRRIQPDRFLRRSSLQDTLNQAAGRDLEGLPSQLKVPGYGPLDWHSNSELQRVAAEYNQRHGFGSHPVDYLPVDPRIGTSIAHLYDKAQHNPDDPDVQSAYQALNKEVRDQYSHLLNNGYRYEFYPEGQDPYPNSPREALMDLVNNKHLYVYPTNEGFGSTENPSRHPMLDDSGLRWNDRPVTNNDLFRAVHDTFGHAKEGVGFRASGEDNAYRQHAAMFSPLANRALAAETRGQNSWVNFGPHANNNQNANQGNTIYADQKATVMPDWVVNPDLHSTASTQRASASYPNVHDHPEEMYPDDKMTGTVMCPNCAGSRYDPNGNGFCPTCGGIAGYRMPNNMGSDGMNSPSQIDLYDSTHVPGLDVPNNFGPPHQGSTHIGEWAPEGWDLEPRQNPQDPHLEARYGPWRGVWNGGRLMDIYHDEADSPLDGIQAGDYDWETGQLGPITQEGINQRLKDWADESGGDYERNALPYSSHLHHNISRMAGNTHTMETLNMEPYPALWSDEHVAGIGGLFKDMVNGVTDGLAALAPIDQEVPGLDVASDLSLGAKMLQGVKDAKNGIGVAKALGKAAPTVMKSLGFGGSGGSAGNGEQMIQTPTMQQIGSLRVGFETPGSVKSVDEHHDDPQKQDQKEFDDGDMTPSNFHNPNLEDSGADGEDGVRDATPGYGFGPNSPAIQSMLGIMPLLEHLLNNGLSGTNHPAVIDLHNQLESECPGYLDNETPDDNSVELVIEDPKATHKDKDKKSSRVADIIPSIPEPASTLGELGTYGTDVIPIQQKPQHCPVCGSTTNGDGSCPNCQFPAAGTGIPDMDKQKQAANNMPSTTEEFDNAARWLQQHGREGLLDDLYRNPQNYGWLMQELGTDNPPIIRDPNESLTVPPAAIEEAPGSMPMGDPASVGNGTQALQPIASRMSNQTLFDLGEIAKSRQGLPQYVQGQIDDLLRHYGPTYTLNFIRQLQTRQDDSAPGMEVTADANNVIPRCPKCKSATTTWVDNDDGDQKGRHARCHSCQHVWRLPGKQSMVALANPLDPAQQVNQTWTDSAGSPVREGEHYLLVTTGYPVPDEVTVISKKPDELTLQLTNTSADFNIKASDFQSGKYILDPVANEAEQTPEPRGNMLDNANVIPEPSTDEIKNMYPNGGATVSNVQNDQCPKCHNEIGIQHTASSPTMEMHQCFRCGHAWETKDDSSYHDGSNPKLSWIMDDSGMDDFSPESQMRDTSGSSRNIHDIASRDPRLTEIHNRLEANQHLQSMQVTAGKHFTPAEKRELIDEDGHARNFDMLDLSQTHYKIDNDYISRRRGNGADVPESHLLLGL